MSRTEQAQGDQGHHGYCNDTTLISAVRYYFNGIFTVPIYSFCRHAYKSSSTLWMHIFFCIYAP